MVSTEFRLDWIQIFFVATDGETPYTQQKTKLGADCGSDHELLIAKFRLKESRENHWTIQVWHKSNPLWLYSGSDKQIQGIRSDRVPEELWTKVCNTMQEAVI